LRKRERARGKRKRTRKGPLMGVLTVLLFLVVAPRRPMGRDTRRVGNRARSSLTT
jgi:hypothetical protein